MWISNNQPEKKVNQVAKMQGDRNPSKKTWEDPEYQDKRMQAYFAGIRCRPTQPEFCLNGLLQGLFSGQWRYAGDADFWFHFDGKHWNPDFISIDQKKIIEMFGGYWHGEKFTGRIKEEEEQQRMDCFVQFGYRTLIIWEHELKDIEKLKKRIIKFSGDDRDV